MAPVRSFSSASAVRLTSVQLMSEQGEYESRVVLVLIVLTGGYTRGVSTVSLGRRYIYSRAAEC